MFSEVKNFCRFTVKTLVSRMRTALCVLCLVLSRVRLFVTPWTVARQDPLSMGFSKQEYWTGLPFPSPGNIPDPGIEPEQVDSLPLEPWIPTGSP